MQLLFHILILLLKFTSLHLANSFSLKPSKLISSNGFFTLDLIHRDSPQSPYYTLQEQSTRSPGLGSISHGLGQGYKRTNDPLNTSSHKLRPSSYLVPNGGDYLIKITLGTPKRVFILVADTGSDLIWIQCLPCDNCIPQKSPLFQPKNSSTFHIIPCTSPICTYPHITRGCLPNNTNNVKHPSPCLYEALYGDGTQSVGVLARDTISLGSSVRHPSTIFGCGFYQRGQIGIQGEGILGLGAGSLSLVSQLGPHINYTFSYCLTPLDSGVNSRLTFGVRLPRRAPKVVMTPFLIGRYPTFYHLILNRISVGKNTSFDLEGDIIIDSGTTLTYLPQDVYDGVKNALARAIRLTPVLYPMEFYDLCYDTRPLESKRLFNPPNVVFHFKGANVVLKAINTFRTFRDGLTCLAMSSIEGTPVFGNVAQVNFEIEYDLKARRISFAPTDCTKHLIP